MPKISDGVDIHRTSYQSAFRVQNRLFPIPPSRRYCSFHPAIPPLLFIPSHHPAAIVHPIPPFHRNEHSIPPSHHYCSFHPTIPPLLFIPSHHPTTIVHSIPPSHHYCSFHPTIPPLLFIPSRHPAAIVHPIPPQ